MNETSFFCYRLQQFGECCGSQCGACQDKERAESAESRVRELEAEREAMMAKLREPTEETIMAGVDAYYDGHDTVRELVLSIFKAMTAKMGVE